jgi:hypothetical protein
VRGFVFDAGAFIALERRSSFMISILNEALHGTIEVVLPRTVIAQVWRGTPRQANVDRLVSAGLRRGSPVVIDELTAERAREIGVKIGQSSIRTSLMCTWRWPPRNAGTPCSPPTTRRSPK